MGTGQVDRYRLSGKKKRTGEDGGMVRLKEGERGRSTWIERHTDSQTEGDSWRERQI